MRKIVIFCLVLTCCLSLFAAQSLKSVLPNCSEEQINTLLANEIIETSTYGSDISAVVPEVSVFNGVVEEAKAATSGFTVNLTALIPYPEAWKDLSQEKLQVALLNVMRSVSTQEGITYISHSAGDKPKVLFDRSWYLSDPSDWKSKIEDPVVEELPESIVSYCYQKDSKFGGNIYTHTFKIDQDEIFLEVNNVTPLKFLGITCLKEGQLHMYLDTYLTDEGILLNAMATVADRDPQVKVLFFTVDLPSAFLRRVTALKDWLTDRLAEVDASAN